MSRWVEGQVIDQTCWTDTLRSLYIRAPIEPFTAGQFTQVGLKTGEKMIYRPYSFASPPQESTLEFYYTVVPEGVLTPLLARLRPGDPIFIAKQAAGRFTLEALPAAKQLWLLATGTGLGVYLAFLKTALLWEKFEKIILLHSVRYAAELSHTQDIAKWREQYAERLHYQAIVTREVIAGCLHERLPILLRDKVIESSFGCEASSTHTQFMLCGNPMMIQDVTACLEARGFIVTRPKQGGQITIENYWKR